MELENLYTRRMSSTLVKLNDKQNIALRYMIDGYNVFLTGSGGTGKTQTINTFKKLYSHIKKIATTSTTGVSALLMNGVTLHSYLGIGLGKGNVEQLYLRIIQNNFIRKRWKELEVLIIDEISMLTPELFDKLEYLARRIRKNENKFGGIQLIISGDFCQLNSVDNPENFCFESKMWDKCVEKTIYLTEIMRQKDFEFQNLLSEIRVGIISDKTVNILNERVNKMFRTDIIPTKIFALNNDVNTINERELNEFAKKGIEFFEYEMSFVYFVCKNKDFAKNNFIKNCIVSQNIQLCIGAQVMLTINLDTENGFVNGSRGIVIGFVDDLPIVKFLNGEERIIGFYTWNYQDVDDTLILQANQIPLKIAFACSIHKTQGITLDYAEINLENIFAPGMAYVALSRIKSINGLCITGKVNINSIVAHPKAIEFYEKIQKEV